MRVGNDEIISCMSTVEECQGSCGMISSTFCDTLLFVLLFFNFSSIYIKYQCISKSRFEYDDHDLPYKTYL